MDRVELVARCREITELTVDDVSDAVIHLYARDGYERIINLERRWPFFETTTTLATVASTTDYTLAGLATPLLEAKSIKEVDKIRLTQIGFEQGEDAWSLTPSGRPQHWSLWANTIRLWPTPNDVYNYTVRGYRNRVAWWDTDGVEIDCDERFHLAVLYYVIARLYQLQEDPEMSNFYASTFVEAVRSTHDDIMRVSSERPLILNRGVRITVPTVYRALLH